MSRMDLEYRKSAAEGASGFGLMIALFDTLANDLRRAAEAEHRNDIPGRCREVSHALVVIGQLQAWVEQGSGGTLADQLISCYASLRCALIDAQARRSARLLEEQMARVLELRECWQKLDQNAAPAVPAIVSPAAKQQECFASHSSEERCPMSWTA